MEDYKYKLSIIIPMYNAEKYIGNCLDSVFGSDLPASSYEVVVVNDGSADKGPVIVAEYIKDHPNLSYYCQENQGQSTARNYGIRVAKGEYVWCVDADDMLDKHLVPILELLNENRELDILAVQLKQVKEDGTFVKIECDQPALAHNMRMSGREAIIDGYNPSSVCALIIKKILIIERHLFFKVGITHQDVELSYRLFAHAEKVYFSDLHPYVYILHPNSTSQSSKPEKKIKYLSDDIVIIKSFQKLSKDFESKDKVLSEVIMTRSKDILFGMVYNLYVNRSKWKSNGINKAVINKMREAGLYPLTTQFGNWKKNLFTFILNRESLIS